MRKFLLVWLLFAGAGRVPAQSAANTNLNTATVWPWMMTGSSQLAASTNQTFAAASATSTSTNTSNTNQLLLYGEGYVLDDKHVLEPGDRISFCITEDKDAPKSLLVADSRELDVPYIGRVSVADKTCKQLAAELKVLLEKEYYYRATVIIGLDSVNKVRGKVYIWGQVHTQGPVEVYFDEKLTVAKALLRAGGVSDFANRKQVKVFRNPEGNDMAKPPIIVNLVDIMENGKTEDDVVLEPGDSIYVPTRLLNF